MVKRARKTFLKKKTFRKIAANYSYKRFSILYRVSYDTTGVKILEMTNDNKVPLSTALGNCPDFKENAKLYHSYKLRGVKIETIPSFPIDNTTATGAVAFALMTNRDNDNFDHVIECDSCVVLSPLEGRNKYVPLNGGNGWMGVDITNNNDGVFVAKSSMNAQSGGQMWYVRLTFYTLLKNAN